MNQTIKTYVTGHKIELCNLWDVIPKIRREYVGKPKKVKLYHAPVYSRPEVSLYDDVAFSTSVHAILHNPIKMITELKRTTSKIKFTRSVTLNEVLEEVAYKSLENMGTPTHFFPIGEKLFALINLDDVRLFIDEKNMRQQLVCFNPERNFTIRIENLEVR